MMASCKVVLAFLSDLRMKSYCVTIQTNLFSSTFSLRRADASPVVAFLPPKNFRRERSDDRKCVCCSQATVLSHRTIYFECGSNFWVCGWNPIVRPFNCHSISSRTFTWYFLLFARCIFQNKVRKLCLTFTLANSGSEEVSTFVLQSKMGRAVSVSQTLVYTIAQVRFSYVEKIPDDRGILFLDHPRCCRLLQILQ